jgi:hypothetical protein
MSEIQEKVSQLNRLFVEIQRYKAKHPEEKTGYCLNDYGSLLNAYREGDIGFDECIELLSKVNPEFNTMRHKVKD